MSRRLFITLLVAGVAMRLVMLVQYDLVNGGEVDVYLADEGIVGLMGKHILEGRALPVFFYGQHYLGALEAYLVALSFALFGTNILAVRAATLVVSLALLWLVYALGRRLCSQQAARWATAIVALGPMYFLQWNLKARGGFVEHVFLVLLVLLLFWRLVFAGERRPGLAAGLGLATGIALWVNQLALAYLFVLAPMWWANPDARRLYKPLVAGLLAGASLLIAYNIAHPLATARSLARKAVVLNRVPVEQRDEHWLERGLEKRIEAIGQGLDKLGLVFGVPPRPEVERLGLTAEARRPGRITRVRQWLAVIPLLAFGLGFWTLRPRHQDGRWTWAGPEQLLLWMFLATFAVGYVSPRYMLPAFPIAALALACARERALPGGTMQRVLTAGITAVMAYGVLSWADVKAATGGGSIERIEALASALERHDLRYCYSAGPMYHVVFAAGERVILSPLQKDRYPAYAKIVSQAPRICYVFRKDQEHKRQHVAFMRLLDRKRISYERFQLCRTGTGVVEVRQDEDCKKQRGKTLYVVLYDFEPRQAITEADMERVRHQERARIDVDRILPLAPLSNRKH